MRVAREKLRLSSCALGERLDVGSYAFGLLASGSLEILAFDGVGEEGV